MAESGARPLLRTSSGTSDKWNMLDSDNHVFESKLLKLLELLTSNWINFLRKRKQIFNLRQTKSIDLFDRNLVLRTLKNVQNPNELVRISMSNQNKQRISVRHFMKLQVELHRHKTTKRDLYIKHWMYEILFKDIYCAGATNHITTET